MRLGKGGRAAGSHGAAARLASERAQRTRTTARTQGLGEEEGLEGVREGCCRQMVQEHRPGQGGGWLGQLRTGGAQRVGRASVAQG